jgi:hypothetical protein
MRLSLSDRFFIPLAILAAAGLIWGALQYRPIGQDPIFSDTRYLMEGSALAQLIPGPGTAVTFDPAAPGGPLARASSTSSIAAGGNMSAGIGALIPPAFESAVVGRTILIEVTLSGADSELTEAAIGYFTVGEGDTGWRRQPLGQGEQVLRLRHTVPQNAPLGNNDWVGIWPDVEGAGRMVSIRRIEVTILPEAVTDAP